MADPNVWQCKSADIKELKVANSTPRQIAKKYLQNFNEGVTKVEAFNAYNQNLDYKRKEVSKVIRLKHNRRKSLHHDRQRTKS